MEYYDIIWTDAARNDLTEIREYIAGQSCSQVIAANWIDKIIAATEIFSNMPHWPLVREERLAELGYRWCPIKRYIVFFRINEETNLITIEAVVHGARNWITLLSERTDN